ncbi:MAG: hypothetical protein KIT73_20285, partial [Burkholderiales bacterium]|nr:hypothetical protein [Burkholderiales bacterium]
MWNHRLIVVLCALSLPACAGGLRSEASGEIGGHSPWLYAGDVTRLTPRLLLAEEGGDMASPEEPPVDMLARPPVPAANLPKQELTRDILYKLLLAEIAGQRGNVRLSARAYLDIAQSTRDPRLARRATELAMVGRFNDLALEAAALWLDVEPESVAARQTVVAALINGNKINDAKPYLRKLIAAEKTNAGLAFMQLYPLLSRAPDKV